MTKLRTGEWYERMAALPTLDSLKVVKDGTFTTEPGRAAKRKEARRLKNEQSKRRQEYHVRVSDYVNRNIKGTQSKRFAIAGAMAKVSREVGELEPGDG